MDLLTIGGILLRRWYVTIPLATLTLLFALSLQRGLQEEYEAAGSLLLAPSDTILDQTAETVVRNLLDSFVADPAEIEAWVRSHEEISGIDVERWGDDAIVVTAEAATAASAAASARDAVTWLASQLEQGQFEAGLPPQSHLSPQVSVLDAEVETDGLWHSSSLVQVSFSELASQNLYSPSLRTARILQIVTEGDSTQRRVRELAGDDVEISLTVEARDRAPVIAVTASGTSSASVLEAFGHVRSVLEDELIERQDRRGIPPSQQTILETLATPESATITTGSVDQVAATVLAVGLVATLLITLAIDGLLLRRYDDLDRHEFSRTTQLTSESPPAGEGSTHLDESEWFSKAPPP